MTSGDQPIGVTTFVAAVDLSGSQYCAVDMTTTGVNLPTANGRIVGVVQNKPKSGIGAAVMFEGITRMVAAGAITKGASVTANAAGQAVAAATGNVVVGVAIDAATGANQIISVLLQIAAGSKA